MKQLLLLLILPVQVFCQNTIGLPDVINYSKQSYGGGLQNWDIKQDNNGTIYIANNEGLLCFDGRNWNVYPLPNKTIVRSVEIGADNRIYVGGQDELGYFETGKQGRLQYQSLTNLIPLKDKSFGDVWDIITYKKEVLFRSPSKIFKLSNNSIASFNPSAEWSYLGICNEQLFAHDYKSGLKIFENGVWKPIQSISTIPENDPVTAILSINKDSALITTLKNGLFIYSNKTISKLASVNNALFESERIYAATRVNSEWIALATNNSGIYITDLKGNIIQRYSGKEGLQNNNVLSIFLDRQSNLWLGLDNGVDLIAYNNAIKQINPALQDGSGYTAIINENKLYIGTSNGLYSVPLQPMKDLSFSKGNFSLVNNTKGQTWSLAEINAQLLLGHHEGAYVIKDNVASLISSNRGFWNFVPLSNTFPTAQIVAGNYNGLSFFDYTGNKFVQSVNVPGFNESSRYIAIDSDDNTWVSQPYHGVYKIIRKNNDFVTQVYTSKNGLPSTLNNHVFKIKNELLAATEKGIYRYNSSKDSFEPASFYTALLGNQSIRYLKEDKAGNIWFIHEKTLGVIDMTGKEPKIYYLPELNNKMLSGFEFIYPVDENNIFLGGEKGFYHINYEKYKRTDTKFQVQLRVVTITNKTDSLLFGGYFSGVNEKQVQQADNIPQINHQWSSIRLEFSSSLFGNHSNLEYSYKLDGFDKSWSDWSKRSEKDYTNLPAGKYTFQVKARNNLGNESEMALYAFTLLPPWYATNLAKLFYTLLFAAALYAVYRLQENKFKMQQVKYEEEQKRLLYIHELERNKTESELIALGNEKLEAEINFKNSELASSAMHLVKKGELLTKIKSELLQVMKGIENPKATADVKKMLKSLNEDDNMDKEWEHFSKHFDKVQSDFLVALKEKHPGITGNELKLCAYLRMNLSTKEIAQLMNISVRGVEISRYRLRKKLLLASETSLFDYLISIQTKV
jgi:ligand-binding sensor domain-containing protein/DNA-binding CsgD family transcriptional regulator